MEAGRKGYNRWMTRWSPCCLLLACGLTACGPQTADNIHTFSGATMGAGYSVIVNAPALPVARRDIEAGIADILDEVTMQMSTYRPDSELMRLNNAQDTGPLPVSKDLLTVLLAAQAISRLTQGAFDITVYPLVELWGFGPTGEYQRPAPAQLQAALARVGYDKLQLEPDTATLRKSRADLNLDLSAIAKGHGVDRLADYLDQLGLNNYLVEIGGELRARGVNGKQAPWQVGIQAPHPARHSVQRVIALTDSGMATSGNYRNFFEQDGTRYSHTINPRSGRPVTHELASVTVLHPSAMLADAWATGLLTLGPEQGLELARRHKLAAYFMIHTGARLREEYTPGFRPWLAVGRMPAERRAMVYHPVPLSAALPPEPAG